MNKFYALYELSTRTPVGISGSMFEDITESQGTAEISEEDAVDFMFGSRVLHNQYIVVENGIGKFIDKDADILKNSARKVQYEKCIIRDLDYRVMFFDRLFVEWSINNGKLVLSIDKIDTFLETTVTRPGALCNIYLTKCGDPTALFKIYVVDMYELRTNKIITLELDITEQFDVWGDRKIL